MRSLLRQRDKAENMRGEEGKCSIQNCYRVKQVGIFALNQQQKKVNIKDKAPWKEL